MKRNFKKNSLAAFAFTMAIVASFAFSPALNSTDDPETIQGYTQSTSKLVPCPISIDTCQLPITSTLCTSGPEAVYRLDREPGLTTCIIQLYVPEIW